MGSDELYRTELKKFYPGKQWADKVDRMSINQVLAVYNRLREKQNLKEKTHEAGPYQERFDF